MEAFLSEYNKNEERLSDDISKSERTKIYRCLTKIRKRIFGLLEDKILDLRTRFKEGKPINHDDIRFFEDLPFGNDVLSQDIFILALKISLSRYLYLELPVSTHMKIHSKTMNPELADLCHYFLEHNGRLQEAKEFSLIAPVSRDIKLKNGMIFPISKDSTANIGSFLSSHDIISLSLVNNWFLDLCRSDLIWKIKEDYYRKRNVKSLLNYHEYDQGLWECAYCNRSYAYSQMKKVRCTDSENVYHPKELKIEEYESPKDLRRHYWLCCGQLDGAGDLVEREAVAWISCNCWDLCSCYIGERSMGKMMFYTKWDVQRIPGCQQYFCRPKKSKIGYQTLNAYYY